ncbi:MAG: MATE family efflux transporter [Treponema sp.]|nr:MATE family efflux transporter [Candidatus Treponema equi]
MPQPRNLTTDSVLRSILFFSIPYLFSSFLQTLYGMADLFITGQFNTTAEITAVSIGSQVMHMFTVMIVGLSMGTTVNIGKAVGGQDNRQAASFMGNSVSLFAILSIGLTAILLLLVHPIVQLVSTPAEAVEETVRYLTICFLGIPFITAYNVISSIFRGLGDSKTPMLFVAIACVLNIALDYLLIGTFGMKASGAALATVIAQAFSVLISLAVILKSKNGIHPAGKDFILHKDTFFPILKIGIPVSLQEGFIQIAFLVITIIVNRRGLVDAAAVGIVEKIICFIFLVPSAMLSTVSALSAQNIGAQKPERARTTLRYAMTICFVFGLAVALIFQTVSEQVVSIFDRNQDVVVAGGQYLRSYIFDTMFAGLHFCFSGYFCAIGKSWISFMHNTISILLIRIPGSYMLSVLFTDTIYPLGFAAMTGSILSAVICAIAYFALRKKSI